MTGRRQFNVGKEGRMGRGSRGWAGGFPTTGSQSSASFSLLTSSTRHVCSKYSSHIHSSKMTIRIKLFPPPFSSLKSLGSLGSLALTTFCHSSVCSLTLQLSSVSLPLVRCSPSETTAKSRQALRLWERPGSVSTLDPAAGTDGSLWWWPEGKLLTDWIFVSVSKARGQSGTAERQRSRKRRRRQLWDVVRGRCWDKEMGKENKAL